MRTTLFAGLAIALAFSANADVAPPDDQSLAIYFLIDNSGSMSDVHRLLQAAVDEQLTAIETDNPSATIVPMFFGAGDRGECVAPLRIEEAIKSSDGLSVPNGPYKRFTPIGSALVGAIDHAGQRPARIFIFSDEQQTELCGIDVCQVAKSYLPRPNLEIVSISVGADPDDTDRLGCIAGAQSIQGEAIGPAENTLEPGSDPSAKEEDVEPLQKGWDDYPFLQRLPLVVIFGLFLAAASAFQNQYGRRAVAIEGQVLDLDKKRENPIGTVDEDSPELDDDEPPLLGRHDIWLATCGFVLAVWLIFYPRGWGPFGEYAYNARSVAWLALNSNFATAFSLLAVSPLIFAGAQFWRHSQARQRFLVVSGVHSSERRTAREQKRIAALAELASVRSQVEGLDFRAPPAVLLSPGQWVNTAVGRSAKHTRSVPVVELETWERVCQTARSKALSRPTPQKLVDIEAETRRIRRYVRLHGLRSKSLADVIALLIEDDLIDERADAWSRLAAAVRFSRVADTISALRDLGTQPAGN